jgi:glycine oxidase
MPASSSDVVVVGGGVIGTAVAWRCARRGMSVTVVDPGDDRGAWHTAAGMLAPVTELHYTETPLLRLNLASLARYPTFVAELTAATGLDVGYAECGTVAIAWDGADLAALRDLQAFGTGLGLSSRMLTGRDLRQVEPALASGLPGGLLAEDDHQIDPRLLHAALRRAVGNAGARSVRSSARLSLAGGRADGVLLEDGSTLSAGTVVLAAGAWSSHVDGVPPDAVPTVRPVKGQTLRLHLPGPPRLRHVVRGTVRGSPIYLVPRRIGGAPDNPTGGPPSGGVAVAGGEIVVGASSEEAGFNQAPRAGAVYELLRDAQSVFPELGEATFTEVSTGLRPGSPDNAPVIGPSGVDRLVLATGHYRNGILLTPVTADAVTDLIDTGTVPEVLAPFTPERFRTAAEVPG